jgi:hypothetical protein
MFAWPCDVVLSEGQGHFFLISFSSSFRMKSTISHLGHKRSVQDCSRFRALKKVIFIVPIHSSFFRAH